MSRTVLTITAVTAIGGVNLTDTLEAANADGESIAASGENITLVVENGSAGSITVTIKTPETVKGLAVAEDTWTIAAGKTYIGRFMARETYMQADGTVHIDFSAVTTIAVAAFRITK